MKFSFRSNTLPGIVAGRPHTLSASRVSSAVIAYVAVVPSHRGRGLARHLVHRGTEQLLESGAMKIRGDCDRDNVAMVKAFERAGYEQFARRRTYHRSLAVAGREIPAR
jgi:RimJ/RimL family protein N-acetyltransferase